MRNWSRELIDMLIRHEGMRLEPYRCPAGKLTIGVGRNLEDNGISELEARVFLNNDICDSRDDCRRVIRNWDDLSIPRKNALIDMMFNLGLPSFYTFEKMIAALEAEDYETAAAEMLNSKWAEQVGTRADELAQMVREG